MNFLPVLSVATVYVFLLYTYIVYLHRILIVTQFNDNNFIRKYTRFAAVIGRQGRAYYLLYRARGRFPDFNEQNRTRYVQVCREEKRKCTAKFYSINCILLYYVRYYRNVILYNTSYKLFRAIATFNPLYLSVKRSILTSLDDTIKYIILYI